MRPLTIHKSKLEGAKTKPSMGRAEQNEEKEKEEEEEEAS